MYAWHDTPTPETLTHLVTVLEGSEDPLQVRQDTQRHYTGPGHDPNGNEYESKTAGDDYLGFKRYGY